MVEVIEALENEVATYKALGEEGARKSHVAKTEASKLLLMARVDPELKTEGLRKAWAYVQLGDLQLEADIAEHMTAAHREVIRSLQTQADLLRTMAASHRAMSESWNGHQR